MLLIYVVLYILNDVSIKIMPHYPLPGDVGEGVGIRIMQNSNASPNGHASQSNPFPANRWGLMMGFYC